MLENTVCVLNPEEMEVGLPITRDENDKLNRLPSVKVP